MRILMLDNEFPPLGGGTGVVNYHLLKQLVNYQDIWVDLVTSSRSRNRYEIERFAERITIYKVPVDNQNIHHATNIELLRYTWRAMWFSRKLLKQHDYDLSFAFAGVPAGAISYILKLFNGIPYLVSLQGPDVPGFEARYNYLYPFLRPLLRVIWRQALIVTAISKEHQRLAYETLPNIPIPIVYNGVETEEFYPTERGTSEINLLCVGRLIERKGQHHLLHAFARLYKHYFGQTLRLTLAGTGDAEAHLKLLASDLGIANAVHFAGFVTREQMPEMYRNADIFVLPSHNEGMSIALLEALSTGLPVIVTATGGTEELVREGENGLIVQWADIDQLASALQTLISSEAMRGKMGAASRQIALSFSWAEITKHYLELMLPEDSHERQRCYHE
jgi:phosphatidyl-myo-inositol dimannoside synthase